jgi:hypothetical protein
MKIKTNKNTDLSLLGCKLKPWWRTHYVFSEKLVSTHKSARRYNPQDQHRHHRCENVKSQKQKKIFNTDMNVRWIRRQENRPKYSRRLHINTCTQWLQLKDRSFVGEFPTLTTPCHTFGRPLKRGDPPLVRSLPTQNSAAQKNEEIHKCLKWDPNPRPRCSRSQQPRLTPSDNSR